MVKVFTVRKNKSALTPHEADPPVAEGQRRVLGNLGSGSQSQQVKPGWAAYVIVVPLKTGRV